MLCRQQPLQHHGEVQSGTMEKLTLNTSYYYLNMCVEEEEFVKKGENS